MKGVFKFAMPFLQASLVKQILVGLYSASAWAWSRLKRHKKPVSSEPFS